METAVSNTRISAERFLWYQGAYDHLWCESYLALLELLLTQNHDPGDEDPAARSEVIEREKAMLERQRAIVVYADPALRVEGCTRPCCARKL